MKNLSIDIETYSSIDLSKCGVYKYIEAEDFEILLFGYSVDGGEVQVVDLAQGEKIPVEIINALTNDNITKWAFNANFERVCLSVYLRKYYTPIFVSYSFLILNSNPWSLLNILLTLGYQGGSNLL